jgi:hypothetical protein
MRDDDRSRVRGSDWLDFLAGKNAGYPEKQLKDDLGRIRNRVAAMREDATTPDTRLADDPMKFNPASVHALLELTMGGVHPGVGGNSLVARFRYFDAQKRRPGLPDDVAALVTRLTSDEADVTLVNVNQLDARELIVQGGAYGEHNIATAIGENSAGNSPHVRVKLAPGAGGKLTLRFKRHVNAPTFAAPW